MEEIATTNNNHNITREAQFLASQQARLDKIRLNSAQQSDNNDYDGNIQQQRKDFWIILKNICFDLDSQLNLLMGEAGVQVDGGGESKVSTDGNSNADDDWYDKKHNFDNLVEKSENGKNGNERWPLYVTTQQRNEALAKLEHIQITIRCLGHYTIHSNKFTTKEANFLPAEIVNFSMPELPTADLRLLNIELQKLKGKSLEAQNIIIPKEKFRFKRYRQALQKRKDEGKFQILLEDKEDSLVEMVDSSTKDTKDNVHNSAPVHHFDGLTLTDKKNCFLKVHRNGYVTEYKDAEDANAATENENDLTTTDANAFLIQDVDCCHILGEGMHRSLHIINVKDTTIEIKTPVSGPVHVTNCSNSKVMISFCRQLRIHDCHGVDFSIHVASGPIIEGCKEMKFYQKDYVSHGRDNHENEQNLYWDVKDFHWLKNLVKSPNFTVHSEEERVKQLQRESQNVSGASVELDPQKPIDDEEEGVESSDDEL